MYGARTLNAYPSPIWEHSHLCQNFCCRIKLYSSISIRNYSFDTLKPIWTSNCETISRNLAMNRRFFLAPIITLIIFYTYPLAGWNGINLIGDKHWFEIFNLNVIGFPRIFGELNCSLKLFHRVLTIEHTPPWVMNSLGSVHVKYVSRKNRMKSCTLGVVPQSETVRFENKIFIILDCNNYWFLHDRSLTVFVIKNWDLQNFSHDKKHFWYFYPLLSKN